MNVQNFTEPLWQVGTWVNGNFVPTQTKKLSQDAARKQAHELFVKLSKNDPKVKVGIHQVC